MSNKSDQTLKVLYIAGSGRSGTSIIANILGQAAGMVSVGEICRMWESALVHPNACGCRKLVPDCSFWNEVFGGAFGGMDAVEPRQMNRTLRKYARTRHFMLRTAQTPRMSEPADLHLLRSNLGRLYRSIGEVSGSRVIVDSSKRPMYGRLLAQVPGIQIYVLHMVRDPRAVAYSWARKKIQPVTGRAAMRMGPIKSSILWTGLNLVTEHGLENADVANKYSLLRYEDFASRPRSAFRAILELLDEPLDSDPFISESKVRISFSHTMAGNTSRFEDGPVDVVPDREWETGMSAWRKVLVSSLAWPLMAHYGYPVLDSKAG